MMDTLPTENDAMGIEISRLANEVRQHKGQSSLSDIASETRLREDLGFTSLDLAEFTVRLEERFGVDVRISNWCSLATEIKRTGWCPAPANNN